MPVSDALAQADITPSPTFSGVASKMGEFGSMLPTYNDLTASFVGVTDPNNEQASKINEIYEWAKDQTDGKDENVLQTLRTVKYKLGESLTKSRLDRLHEYVTLQKQAKAFRLRAKAMEEK